MTQYFNVHVPSINEEKLPVTVAAPSKAEVQLFLKAVVNGMYLDKPHTLDECAIQQLNADNLIPDIHLDERGLVAGSLIDIDTMDSAKLMSVYSSVGHAQSYLKEIVSSIGELDDGTFDINIDDENPTDVMRAAYDSLSGILVHLADTNMNVEIALLQHNPVITALNDLIFFSNQDKDGSIFICEESANLIKHAERISGMDSQALLRESVNNLLRTIDCVRLIDKPYNDIKTEIGYLAEKDKLTVEDAIILSETLDFAIKASSHDDLLMTSPTSNKELAP